LATAVGAGIFFVYLATAQYTSSQSVDSVSAMLSAWKLATHGTLAIPEFNGATPWIHDVNGTVVSDRMPGVILFAVPFYWLLGHPDAPTLYPAALAAATATAAAMAFLFVLFRRLAGGRLALGGTLLAAFGTATWTISADVLWPHGLDQLWLVLATLALASERHLPAGFAFAAGVFTRPHLAVAPAICGIWSGIRRRSIRPMWQVGVASLLGVCGLLVYAVLVFGRLGHFPGIYGVAGEKLGGVTPAVVGVNLAGTLVSPERGVLVLSPFLLLLLPGVIAAWRSAPWWIRASAVSGLAYLAVQVTGNYFAGGTGFYSYRYPIETLTLLAPLLILCWVTWTSRSRWRRITFAILAWFSVVQHAVGAFVYHPYLSTRYEPWRHYLLVDGLRDGNALTYSALVAVGLIAARLIWPMTRRQVEPAAPTVERVAVRQ
jgi:alpha-1,2-mannosyltransferase